LPPFVSALKGIEFLFAECNRYQIPNSKSKKSAKIKEYSIALHVVSKYFLTACKGVFRAFAKGNLIPLRANSMRNPLTAYNIDNVSHKPIGELNLMFKIWS
jgi:hypothetical protein